VCDIAWQASSSEVRQKLSSAAKRMGYSTYANSCIWADQLRKKQRYDYLKPLHYVNVARESASLAGAKCLSESLDKQTPRCVIDAIIYHQQRISQPKLSQRKKDKALLFLGHWLGDIHQPLHVSYRDDLGGNRRKVIFEGQVSSLHRVWDSQLLYCRYQGGWRKLGKQLFSRSAPEGWWNHQSSEQRGAIIGRQGAALKQRVISWANESLALTRQIYADLSEKQKRYLPSQYCHQYHPVVLNRLHIAGLRLGRLLAVVAQ